MTETFEEMRARHEREILELRDKCQHSSISEWLEVEWAPGHLTGYRIKVCRICGKEIERDTSSLFTEVKSE